MKSRTIPPFGKLYERLSTTLQHQADEAFAQFEQDPSHPSLHFKEVRKKRNIWSARINLDYRALGFRDDHEMIWFWLGSHSDYDKIIAHF
jgi:hypothetical protein